MYICKDCITLSLPRARSSNTMRKICVLYCLLILTDRKVLLGNDDDNCAKQILNGGDIFNICNLALVTWNPWGGYGLTKRNLKPPETNVEGTSEIKITYLTGRFISYVRKIINCNRMKNWKQYFKMKLSYETTYE